MVLKTFENLASVVSIVQLTGSEAVRRNFSSSCFWFTSNKMFQKLTLSFVSLNTKNHDIFVYSYPLIWFILNFILYCMSYYLEQIFSLFKAKCEFLSLQLGKKLVNEESFKKLHLGWNWNKSSYFLHIIEFFRFSVEITLHDMRGRGARGAPPWKIPFWYFYEFKSLLVSHQTHKNGQYYDLKWLNSFSIAEETQEWPKNFNFFKILKWPQKCF